MIELLKRNRLLVAAAGVLVLLIVLLTVRYRDPDRVRFVDETVQAIAYPFQVIYTGVTSTISNTAKNYLLLVRVQEENKQLKLQIKALEEELNHYVNSSIQFNLLREQLGFKEEEPEKRVFAEVIGESSDSLHHLLLINKGTRAGIHRNYPVVLREGVVGRVISTTLLQSTVQLVVDRRHRFPVIIQRSRERLILEGGGGSLRLMAPDRGIVYGSGDGLRMERVRMLADVQKGDRVITSGLAGIFPKGLMVGIITEVGREQHELFQRARIQPVVDFNKIEGVYVILRDGSDQPQPFFTE